MKNNHIIKKTLIGIQTGIVLFLTLTSCKNFLNAGKVSEEIKDSIAYNNAKTVNIVISCKEDMGTIYPQQSYNAKLGYDFEIQFIINSDNYVIKNPDAVFEAVSKYDNTVSREDCVEFTPVERTIEDIKLGLYKAKARITKDNNDIMIRPVCTTLPSVVDIYPPFVPSGYAQDTTIKITFSKPMNPESFGNFECIFITSETGPVKTNYDTPYFSSDYTVLNIPLAKGKRLIPKDTTETKQITLTISTAELKDYENLSFSKDINYTFCVNQEIDKKAPVIESALLNKTDNFQINNLDFEQWGNNESVFSQNHLKNSFLFCVQGYDIDSGISGLRITETYYRLTNGTPVTDIVSQSTEYEQPTFIAEAQDYSVYQIAGTHNIKTLNNGVIKIDLQLIDKSENPSAPKTFYVINDTQIDASLIKFEEFEEPRKYLLDSETENFTMTLKQELKDYYYKDYYSDFNITVNWGYKDDEITNLAQRDGLEFSFTRNVSLLTYIKITCSDNFGNQKIISKVIPPKLSFDSSCVKVQRPKVNITPFSYDSLKQIVSYNDAELLIYDIHNTANKNVQNNTINLSVDPEIYNKETFQYATVGSINEDYKNFYYFFYVIKYSDNTYFSSPISNNFISAQAYNGSPNILETNSTSLSGEPAPGPEVLSLTCKPVTNSGCHKISINTDNLNSDYTWTYCFTNTKTGNSESFSINTFYIRSSAKYSLTLIARNSEGVLYKKTNQKMQILSGEPFSELNLSEDTTPPTFSIYNDKSFIITPKGVILLSEPQDAENSMYTDPQDPSYGELTYYFLPNPGIHVCDFTHYNQNELEQYQVYKKTLKYKIGSKQLFIPFNDISESFYTLCMVVKDKAGNSTVECMPVLYKLLRKTVTSSLKRNGNNSYRAYTLTTTFDTEDEAKRFCHGVITSDEKGIILIGQSVSISKNALSTSFNVDSADLQGMGKVCKFVIGPKYTDENILVEDAGIYDLYYSLEGTQTDIQEKSMWECVNGYQISMKAPQTSSTAIRAHIHTLYSRKNLSENAETEEEAINMWLRKGDETGIVSLSLSQIYDKSNWDAVPRGWYYTVIVHYADGTRFMSQVKQKQY